MGLAFLGVLLLFLVHSAESNAELPTNGNSTEGKALALPPSNYKTGCIGAPGAWIPGSSQPRYDASSCPLIKSIARGTYCLAWRKDLRYLSWAWQPPAACGKAVRFDASFFLKRMCNKVVALVGDSIMQGDFFPSLLCQVGVYTPVVLDPARSLLLKADAYVAYAYNVTLVNYWSPFLVASSQNSWYINRLRKKKKILGMTAVNLFRLDQGWAAQLGLFDLLLLSTAAHWPKANTWEARFFVNFHWRLLTPQLATLQAYRVALDTVMQKLRVRRGLKVPAVYFLSASPRIKNCELSGGSISTASSYNYLATSQPQSASWFPLQRNRLAASGFRFVDITHMSLLRSDAMVSGADTKTQDCLHPCVPGLPDWWVDAFYLRWLQDPIFIK